MWPGHAPLGTPVRSNPLVTVPTSIEACSRIQHSSERSRMSRERHVHQPAVTAEAIGATSDANRRRSRPAHCWHAYALTRGEVVPIHNQLRKHVSDKT